MVLVGSDDFSGIALTQVGDPLPNGREGLFHSASSHRVTGGAFTSVSDAVDQEVGELVFLASDITEGRMDPELLAEAGPVAEVLVAGSPVFGGCGSGGERESSAEISLETSSVGRWSSTQGVGCG